MDTDFYQPQKWGASKITEVALCDMEIGEAVVNALFDHDLRAIKKSIRLGSRRSNKNV